MGKWLNHYFEMKFAKFGITLLFLIGMSNSAYAYIDPGSGSVLLQLLFGGVAGGAFILKFYWQKIKFFFRKDKHSQE